jgi:Putative rhamnosyl transferase
MKHPKQQPRSRVGYLIALNVILITLWINLRPGHGTSPTTATATTATVASSSTATTTTATKACAKPDILFTCPDGRRGLHIVHTRFLVSQAKANLLFQSTRLQLMHTFLLPSLRFQSSKKFVLYASYDPDLSENVVSAMESALKLTEVHVLINPERHTAMALNFSEIALKLKEFESKVDKVDIYITSRLDIDDTTHVGSVEAIQKFACSGREEKNLGGKDNGDGEGSVNIETVVQEPPPIRVAYIQGGQLWFPSKKPSRPYGEVGK